VEWHTDEPEHAVSISSEMFQHILTVMRSAQPSANICKTVADTANGKQTQFTLMM
jgi:hypothetical protein